MTTHTMSPDRWRRVALAVVRTATSSGADAIAAWSTLPDDFDLDEVWDPELGRLLAGAGAALTAAGHDDRFLPRMRGIARKNLVEQQLCARRWAGVLQTLHSSGVDAGVVGGALLTRSDWAYADQPSVRSADDTRVTVRREQAERAVAALVAGGVVSRSPARVRRRVELHNGVPIGLADDSWSELWWAPSPSWPVDVVVPASGTTIMLGNQTVTAPPVEVVMIATCLDLEAGRRGVSAVVDLDRILARSTPNPEGLDGLVAAMRGGPAAMRWLELARRVRDHADETWLDEVGSVSARRTHAVRDTARRLGGRRAITAAPELLAERWHRDRVGELPAALAERVGQRGRRLLGRGRRPGRGPA